MPEKIFIVTAIFEILAIAGRLTFGSMRSRKKQLKRIFPIRIHHGYIGVLLLIMTMVIPHDVLYITGASLIISDLTHHFIILPLWVGRAEFP